MFEILFRRGDLRKARVHKADNFVKLRYYVNEDFFIYRKLRYYVNEEFFKRVKSIEIFMMIKAN